MSSAISNWDDELTRYRTESVHQRGSIAIRPEVSKQTLYKPQLEQIVADKSPQEEDEEDELEYETSTFRTNNDLATSPEQSVASLLTQNSPMLNQRHHLSNNGENLLYPDYIADDDDRDLDVVEQHNNLSQHHHHHHHSENDWVELIGAKNIKYRLYYNKTTKETTHIPPDGFVCESAADIMLQQDMSYPEELITFSERLQFHVDAMNRHIEQAMGIATHMGKTATDSLLLLRNQVQQLQSCVQSSTQNVVDYLIGSNNGLISWDFTNSAAVDYYRACSTRTNHRSLQYNMSQLPQYISSQPWTPQLASDVTSGGNNNNNTNNNNANGSSSLSPGAMSGSLPTNASSVNEKKNNQIRICVEPDDSRKYRMAKSTVEISVENTAEQLIALAYNRLNKEVPPNEILHNFILKVVGNEEYLFGGTPLYAYEWIRHSLQNQDPLRLTLMRRPEPTVNIQQIEKCNELANDYIQRIKPDVELLERDTFSDLLDVSLFEHDSLSYLTYYPMYSIQIPFHVQLLGIEHLNSDTLPRYHPDMSQFYIKVVLFHGCVELPFSQNSSLVDCSEAPMFNETLYGDSLTLISSLPRESRIGYILFGKMNDKRANNALLPTATNEKKLAPSGGAGLDDDQEANPQQGDIPLAWVVNQIVDFQGEMLAGPRQHLMWSFPKDTGKKGQQQRRRDADLQWLFRATNLDNQTMQSHPSITLHVQYPVFNVPVIAPLVPVYSEPNVKLVGRELVRGLDQQQSALLLRAIDSDPLYELSSQSKQLLWNARHFLIDTPAALPKILACVDWSNRDFANEAYRLLPLWATPTNLISVIELLDARYADYQVREYAVKLLALMPDDDLQLVLLQLVQCIKYEPYHDSPLSRFLIERAIASPVHIGHTFFWHLKAEVHDPQVTERFTCILEELLSNIGPFVDDLYKQLTTVQKLQHVAECVVRYKREYDYSDEQTMTEYHKMLTELNESFFLPQGSFQVPLNPRCRATKLLVEKCKYMSSKMVPLWLVFENADPQAPPIYLIFKSGDDLRQDILTLQILRIMDRLWSKHNLDMRLKPYNVIATGVNEQGEGVGMIEVVLNSDTTSSIQVKYGGGARGALKSEPIDLYLRAYNNTPDKLNEAVQTFVSSCAGYCVATFVLGIGDRHNGNIMVTQSGNLFHIDFGHFLGNFKKKFGVNRERAAFVLTPEMAYVMGGKDYKKSEQFKNFKLICSRSYKVLRQHAGLLETLFILMVAAGMPELLHERDILYLRDKLCLDVEPKQAQKYLQDEIKRALDSTSRRFDNYIHNLKHG